MDDCKTCQYNDNGSCFMGCEVRDPIRFNTSCWKPTEYIDLGVMEYGDGEKSADGLKYDLEKIDFTFLQDWDLALAEICKLSAFGTDKYSRGGWIDIKDPERLKKAMLRHYFKEPSGEPDEDSGFMHDVAVAWNALGALQIRLKNMADKSL